MIKDIINYITGNSGLKMKIENQRKQIADLNEELYEMKSKLIRFEILETARNKEQELRGQLIANILKQTFPDNHDIEDLLVREKFCIKRCKQCDVNSFIVLTKFPISEGLKIIVESVYQIQACEFDTNKIQCTLAEGVVAEDAAKIVAEKIESFIS
jgi:hypothetical protein